MFTHFNHSQFRRYILAFGKLFSRITLTRADAAGAEVQRFVVPIEFGPKERWYTRLVQDPNFTQGVSQVLPRLGYQMTGLAYDSKRKLNTMNSLSFPHDDMRKRQRMYVGVPYTLTFELAILTKLQQDGYQIVEQILPYFTPDLHLPVLALPNLGLVDVLPLTLTSVTSSDNYDGDFEHRRHIEWTLTFTWPINIYGPKRAQGRIEEIFVDLYDVPLDTALPAPEYLATETGDLLLTEDETGHLVTEETPDIYTRTGRVARVHVAADPVDQMPSDDPTSRTTLTEYDGDVKRSVDMTDEDDL